MVEVEVEDFESSHIQLPTWELIHLGLVAVCLY